MIDDNSQNDSNGQSGMNSETELRNKENETGQQSGQQSSQQPEQAEGGKSQGDSGSGFVGSTGDQSSDYLTKDEKQSFQPEGQGSSDSDAGDADITTGQPTSSDATLDDGADTRR